MAKSRRRCAHGWLTAGIWLGFALVALAPAMAARVAYDLQPGALHQYQVRIETTSEIATFNWRQSQSRVATGQVELRVATRRDRTMVVDLSGDFGACRRYLQPTGAVSLVPDRDPLRVPPLLWELPAGDWPVGTTHRVTRQLDLDDERVPITWTLTLAGIDEARQRAAITVTGQATLRSSQRLRRQLSMTGALEWDLKAGCPSGLRLNFDYRFDFRNKEFAVIKPLWALREKRTVQIDRIGGGGNP